MSCSFPRLCWNYEKKNKIKAARKVQYIAKSIMKQAKKRNGKARNGGSKQQRTRN